MKRDEQGHAQLKRYHPVIIFIILVASTTWTSWRSYRIAERDIRNDLRQALVMTKAEAPQDWLATDTVRRFRSNLVIPRLKRDAQLAIVLSEDDAPRVCAYISYNTAQIFSMSDQRWSVTLGFISLLWLGLSLRRRSLIVGNVRAEVAEPSSPMYLTPMQERLMEMFLSSPTQELTKQEICDKLWPGKPDASESLYTLIRRTKQTLGETGAYRIESNRGRSYLLKKI